MDATFYMVVLLNTNLKLSAKGLTYFSICSGGCVCSFHRQNTETWRIGRKRAVILNADTNSIFDLKYIFSCIYLFAVLNKYVSCFRLPSEAASAQCFVLYSKSLACRI